MGWFEIEFLVSDDNIVVFIDLFGVWIDWVYDCKLLKDMIFDMDLSVSLIYGD